MVDYEKVRASIKAILKQEGWDDGHLGPFFIRLAWHSSGTYDKHSGTGGSNGATMRFKPESTDPANSGLDVARNLLEPIKQEYNISYGDVWTLAACVGLEDMGGPKILWKPGRTDAVDGATAPPNKRLPNPSGGQDHQREMFYRMGFNDREIVALAGAHAVGRCHNKLSRHEGYWTHTPTLFSNNFFVELLKNKYTEKVRESGMPLEYTNQTGELLMLPSDLVFLNDPVFRKISEEYANNKQWYFDDFAAAFAKLLELGVHRE